MKTLCIVLAVTAFIICAVFLQENTLIILNHLRGLGWFAPILFLLIYCLATLLLLPTLILTFAGGALFGPKLGVLLNVGGATFGAACAFMLSRYLTLGWITQNSGSKLNKLITGVERNGWQFVALLRLIPIVPFNLVNYGLGVTRIKFSHYIVTTFIFLIPGEIIYTYCGYAGMDALTRSPFVYKSTSLGLLIGFGLFFLGIKLFKHYRRKSD